MGLKIAIVGAGAVGAQVGGFLAKDGEDVDRYFLHVYSGDTTLLLLDVDGDPETIDPITITGGNIQIHASSCDDPQPQ